MAPAIVFEIIIKSFGGGHAIGSGDGNRCRVIRFEDLQIIDFLGSNIFLLMSYLERIQLESTIELHFELMGSLGKNSSDQFLRGLFLNG